MNLKNKIYPQIRVAIDSPSASGAGTTYSVKLIAKQYNLLYCDTGKIYRYMANC